MRNRARPPPPAPARVSPCPSVIGCPYSPGVIVNGREATGPDSAAASDDAPWDQLPPEDEALLAWAIAGMEADRVRPLDRSFALADRVGEVPARPGSLSEKGWLRHWRNAVLGLRGAAGPVQQLSEVLAPDQVRKILRAAEAGNEVLAVHLTKIYADDMLPDADAASFPADRRAGEVAGLADATRTLCRRLAPLAGTPRWLSGRVRDILAALLRAVVATAEVEARNGPRAALDDDPRRDRVPPGRLVAAAPAAPNAPNLCPSLAAFAGEVRTGAPCGSALAA